MHAYISKVKNLKTQLENLQDRTMNGSKYDKSDSVICQVLSR